MTDFRYKAFLSYSHRDDVWAKWAQRVLESYRVPRELVGTDTNNGVVPARIKPIFLDRTDLSSAPDLDNTVRQTLAESEYLIVVCSPDAAGSHWVAEEIREFARLGRQERILCVIVDGDPDSGDQACFPDALKEAGLQEPLAADVRTWADGKRVAKLKLVAGLLGIRLDQLLQRDLQRRRKQKLAIALGAVSVLTLIVMTVVSQVSRQHERDETAQMVSFIVDLGQKLQFETDLETLATISTQASRYFQNLDADKLDGGTGKKVALVMRQTANISQLQGRSAEALRGFIESRDFFARLSQRFSTNADLLFELGNAEFYIGGYYVEQGRHDLAEQAFQTYHQLTGRLLDLDPENPDWIMETSYSHMNLAVLDLDRGKDIDTVTLAHLNEAIRLAETVMVLKPGDEQIVSDYANALAWAADAQEMVCNLETALSSRERVRNIAQSASSADPNSSELQTRHAFALSGIAKLQVQLGKFELASDNFELVISIFQRLSVADPSNVFFHLELLYSRASMARLSGETEDLDVAKSVFQDLESEFVSASESGVEDKAFDNKYIDFLLNFADIEARQGNTRAARNYLQRAQSLLLDSSLEQSMDGYNWERLMQHKYQWWDLFGTGEINAQPVIAEAQQLGDGGFRSCPQVDLVARMNLIKGDRESANRNVTYLASKGYVEPAFKRFCKKYDFCNQ